MNVKCVYYSILMNNKTFLIYTFALIKFKNYNYGNYKTMDR